MIHKTTGIVLHSIRYGETSVIAKVFTRELGIQSCLVPGVRKTRARVKFNLFQPLTPVDLVIYSKERGGMSRVREISCQVPLKTIPYDILKSSIAMFLSEIMARSFREQDANFELFDFILDAVRILDGYPGRISDFHLVFLLQLSRFLGFQPRNNYDERHGYFNLREGMYDRFYENEDVCLDREMSGIFHRTGLTALDELEQLHIPASMRRTLLLKILAYYQYHMHGLGEIKSLPVLEAVLHH